MKKKLLPIILVIALVLCAFAPAAFGKGITFYITRAMDNKYITDNTKDLAGSNWQISNLDTASSDFIENSDVIGFRTRAYQDNKGVTGTPYSAYHTFSRFVYRYSLPYTTTPATHGHLTLVGRIDSTGQNEYINFDGEWVS